MTKQENTMNTQELKWIHAMEQRKAGMAEFSELMKQQTDAFIVAGYSPKDALILTAEFMKVILTSDMGKQE